MALTQSQKYTILGYLGWPPKTLAVGDMCYSKIVSDKLDNFPADAEALATALLAKIAIADTQLSNMNTRSNVKSVDDIEFFEHGAVDLRAERSKLIRDLAVMFDIARLGNSGNMFNVCL